MIIVGDCLEAMREMESGSVTAIVTDPPYALEFMGKGWDRVLPSIGVWQEALRILKPGGMLLAFGGTRTYHRLTCSIEDAGFEIRDCILWLYGAGFPKSLDISKAIDKVAGAEREVVGQSPNWRPAKTHGGAGFDKAVGEGPAEMPLTAPATQEALTWQGYGTGLKPAWEPIVVAMWPLDGTFVRNALQHGVAGLNVDGCRVGDEKRHNPSAGNKDLENRYTVTPISKQGEVAGRECTGRWPANLILDEAAGAMMGGPSRFFYCAKAPQKERPFYCRICRDVFLAEEREDHRHGYKRLEHLVSHPTQKPVALMRYLVRLVSMPVCTRILDPFMGAGSTGVACRHLGVEFVGVEIDPDYMEIAKRRITGK